MSPSPITIGVGNDARPRALLLTAAQGKPPPAQRQPPGPGQAEFVICDQTIERDFEELKQELGLGHFEGRGWRGFHHHASLCIAAYAFLVAERCRFSPQGWRPRLRTPERPAGYRPRGSSRAPGAAQPGLDRDPAPAPRGGTDAPAAPVPLLPARLRAATHNHQFMTP